MIEIDEATDLGETRKALAREETIRKVMADTGESREIVTEMFDAHASMDEEAVLDLCDGEPRNLRDALERWLEELKGWDAIVPRDRVRSDLETVLRYSWPMPQIEVKKPDDESLEVWVAGEFIFGANHDDHGFTGLAALSSSVKAVHRATVKAIHG